MTYFLESELKIEPFQFDLGYVALEINAVDLNSPPFVLLCLSTKSL